MTTTRPPHSQRTASPEQSSEARSNSPMCIWIVNPFDQLPNETDVPLRYWALCRTFAALGHEVIWWSSDFSHRTKAKRKPCPPMDGFNVRLIATSPYTKNISFARLKNHRQFAQGFYREAMAGLQNNQLKAPNRIVVSLPPLGIAEAAFKIRDYLNQRTVDGRSRVASAPDPHTTAGTANWALKQPSYAQPTSHCQVIIDIMDAWPETFYRALPSPLRKTLGPILLAPMHRSAQRAYQGADKISAVGQNYLNLAQQYLERSRVVSCPWGTLAPDSSVGTEGRAQRSEVRKKEAHLSSRSDETTTPHPVRRSSQSENGSAPPLHLCYHGTDLERFPATTHRNSCDASSDIKNRALKQPSYTPLPPPVRPSSQSKDGSSLSTLHSPLPTPHSAAKPLQLVYIGALETSYDLNTIIEAVESLNQSGTRTECHIAGAGSQEATLKARIQQANQAAEAPIIIFHGHLQKAALDALLENSHFGMIPMQADSFVGLPYKMADYTRTGLPILSSLGGESRELIEHKKAGAFYRSGSRDHLVEVIQSIVQQPALYNSMASNSRQIAEQLFDRTITYQALARFIVN